MDIEQHIYLRSFVKPSGLPVIKALVFALVAHSLFFISWQHNEKKAVAEIPQWINIKLTASVEEQSNKQVIESHKKTEIKQQKIIQTSAKKNKVQKLISKKKKTAGATTFIKADSRPYFLQNPKPVYPIAARRRGMQGIVLLNVEISHEGYVKDIEIIKTSGYRALDRSAIKSVRKWRFIPAKIAQKNVPSVIEIPIRFILKESDLN